MLETIREYAAEQLAESGDAVHMRDRHLAYYLQLAEEAEPELTGSDQGRWFERLALEEENLREALAFMRFGRRGTCADARGHDLAFLVESRTGGRSLALVRARVCGRRPCFRDPPGLAVCSGAAHMAERGRRSDGPGAVFAGR